VLYPQRLDKSEKNVWWANALAYFTHTISNEEKNFYDIDTQRPKKDQIRFQISNLFADILVQRGFYLVALSFLGVLGSRDFFQHATPEPNHLNFLPLSFTNICNKLDRWSLASISSLD
jgi:hypothetical protein